VIKTCISTIAAGLVLCACASQEQKIAAASEIKSSDDQFLPYREYKSGLMKETGGLLSQDGTRANILIGRVDKSTGVKKFAVQVLLHYSEDRRRKFESARSGRGETLQLVKIEQVRKNCVKRLDTCTFSEIVDVVIPESGLRSAGVEGYPIKLFARSGATAVIDIPKPVITSLLAMTDADPANAAAPAKVSRAQ
jgi:hypothetical protein